MRLSLPLIALVSAALIVGSAVQPLWTLAAVVGLIIAGLIIAYPAGGIILVMMFFLVQNSPLYSDYAVFSQSYTMADVVAAIVLAGYLFQNIRDSAESPLATFRGMRGMGILTVVGYTVFTMATAAWSPAATTDIVQFIRSTFENGVLFVLAVLLLRSRRETQRAASLYAITAVILALYTIFNYMTTSGEAQYRGGDLGLFNENELSVLLSVAPAFAYIAARDLSARGQAIALAVTVPPILFAMIILTSRGAFLSVAAGILAAVVLSRQVKHRVGLAAVIVVLVGGLLVLSAVGDLPYYFTDRFSQASYDQVGGRLPFWIVGLQLFAQNPVFGLGALGFESVIQSYHVGLYGFITSPHSVYIGTLVNGGIVAALFLILMLAVMGWVSIIGTRRNPAGIFIYVTLVTSMISGEYLSEHWMWVALATIFVVGGTQVDAVRAQSAQPETVGVSLPAAVGG